MPSLVSGEPTASRVIQPATRERWNFSLGISFGAPPPRGDAQLRQRFWYLDPGTECASDSLSIHSEECRTAQ